jgi:hypothetical protein
MRRAVAAVIGAAMLDFIIAGYAVTGPAFESRTT